MIIIIIIIIIIIKKQQKKGKNHFDKKGSTHVTHKLQVDKPIKCNFVISFDHYDNLILKNKKFE